MLNIIDWLAEKETYESFAEVDIPLDEPSPLLDKEIPENTTEPEPEPWSTPLPTYHWFDPATFAPGSFGSTETPVEEPVYSIDHEPYLPNNQSFTIQVSAEGLQPGQIVSDFSFGMFLDGGQQIAKVQNSDGAGHLTTVIASHFCLRLIIKERPQKH